jgi:putative oxidoreductase
MLQNIALLVLRLTFGGVMLVAHGMPKLMGFNSMMNTFPDPLGVGSSLSLGLAIFGEVICPVAIILGYFTRISAIPAAITMFVAVFIFHINDGFGKMELGLLYLVGYVAIALLGPGQWSLDKVIRKKT